MHNDKKTIAKMPRTIQKFLEWEILDEERSRFEEVFFTLWEDTASIYMFGYKNIRPDNWGAPFDQLQWSMFTDPFAPKWAHSKTQYEIRLGVPQRQSSIVIAFDNEGNIINNNDEEVTDKVQELAIHIANRFFDEFMKDLKKCAMFFNALLDGGNNE